MIIYIICFIFFQNVYLYTRVVRLVTISRVKKNFLTLLILSFCSQFFQQINSVIFQNFLKMYAQKKGIFPKDAAKEPKPSMWNMPLSKNLFFLNITISNIFAVFFIFFLCQYQYQKLSIYEQKGNVFCQSMQPKSVCSLCGT